MIRGVTPLDPFTRNTMTGHRILSLALAGALVSGITAAPAEAKASKDGDLLDRAVTA